VHPRVGQRFALKVHVTVRGVTVQAAHQVTARALEHKAAGLMAALGWQRGSYQTLGQTETLVGKALATAEEAAADWVEMGAPIQLAVAAEGG